MRHVKHLSSEQWHDYLSKCLPDGQAWAVAHNPLLNNILQIVASEIHHLDLFIATLLDELNPAQAEKLLPEWERDVSAIGSSTQLDKNNDVKKRKQNLIAQLTFNATITKQFILDLAKNFALSATVSEVKPNIVTISLPSNSSVYFLCSDNRCGDALLNIVSDTLFEARLKKVTPSHIDINFNYNKKG